MEKKERKQRDIKFKSEKNREVVCVHTKEERIYAEGLEKNPDILSYETNKPLDKSQYGYVSSVMIRKNYFEMEWCSNFYITYKDQSKGVREMIREEKLEKLAEMEKLEFSRRFWQAQKIDNWKVVIIKKG